MELSRFSLCPEHILGQENVSRTNKIVLSLFVLSYAPQIILETFFAHQEPGAGCDIFIQLDKCFFFFSSQFLPPLSESNMRIMCHTGALVSVFRCTFRNAKNVSMIAKKRTNNWEINWKKIYLI